jgi:hypothetical protein
MSGLTSMHVVGDFLKHRIAPLQQRARLCCWFIGSNDIGRIQRRSGTDLSWEELEVLVKGITGESFVPESLILPEGIPALCDDAGLRSVNLATLPTLDECGVTVHQTGGWDPIAGSRSLMRQLGAPRLPGWPPAPLPRPLAPWTRAKGLQAAPPPQAALGCRRRRGDVGCVAPTDRLFWTPPPPVGAEEAGSQKRQRTAGGAEESSSQAQGAQRRASPPPPQPPPPSGSPPPIAPRDGLPQGYQQQQQQQQQQQKQRSPRF